MTAAAGTTIAVDLRGAIGGSVVRLGDTAGRRRQLQHRRRQHRRVPQFDDQSRFRLWRRRIGDRPAFDNLSQCRHRRQQRAGGWQLQFPGRQLPDQPGSRLRRRQDLFRRRNCHRRWQRPRPEQPGDAGYCRGGVGRWRCPRPGEQWRRDHCGGHAMPTTRSYCPTASRCAASAMATSTSP